MIRKNIFSPRAKYKSIVILLSFGFALFSCKPAKYLQKDEYLLQKNTLEIVNKDSKNENLGFEPYELEDLIKPKANTKLLRLPVYLYLYNMTDPVKAAQKKIRKDTKCNGKIDKKLEKINVNARLLQIKRDSYEKASSYYTKYDKKLKKEQNKKSLLDKGKCDWKSIWQKIGEPPVIYKQFDALKSSKQIKIFLKNKGYYNSDISFDITDKKDKTHEIYINYKVNTGKPYRIKKLKYNIEDLELYKILVADTSHSLLKKGKRLDSDLLQDERARIELILRNLGYFKFSKEYITYSVDTTSGNFETDLTLNLRQISTKDNIKENHKKYVFSTVSIYPNFDPKTALTEKKIYYNSFDTTYYIFNSKYRFSFLNREKQTLKSRAMVRGIYIYTDSLFNLNDIQDSYRYLSALKIIKIANINLSESSQDSLSAVKDSMGRLDCVIKLSQDKRQSYTFEITGTNSSGNIGAAGNVLFQHRNVFGNGEVLDLNFKLALEHQTKITQELKRFFDSKEYGVELSLKFPRMLAPVKLLDFSKRFTPKTEISLIYNRLERHDYTRKIAGISYNYYWNSSETVKHVLMPVILDLVKLEKPDSAFLAYINDYSLQESYENHLILGTSYSIVLNNQLAKYKRNYSYTKIGVKTSGNLLTAINKIADSPEKKGNYTILDNYYSQFIKGEFDFRYYRKLGRYNDKMVLRTFAGAAYPYGNSHSIPFGEKYFSGGANSIRAWQVRTLGPGSYHTPDAINVFPNQTGDLKLEANFEYRMKLFWMIEGAFFVDAGNIWAINDSDTREGAIFNFANFYKDIAVGTGYGFRLDFDFFIVRFDFGLRLRMPYTENGKYWIPGNRKFTNSDWAFTVGIGYPF